MIHNSLPDNLRIIRDRIGEAARRIGRDSAGVTLIAVTKTVGIRAIREAVDAGLRDFGENRVQEARDKISSFSVVGGEALHWHFIGHLQKNKAKFAAGLFDLIHSVDSADLAEELNRQAARLGKKQRVLVQVKLSEEATKHGVERVRLDEFFERIVSLKNLVPEGLMTMPPYFDDPQLARPFFSELRELRDRIAGSGIRLPELSMGMSNDFEVAVEEGATMVRVGTALFGERSN